MKKTASLVILFSFVLVLITACKKKEQQDEQPAIDTGTNNIEMVNAILNKMGDADLELPSREIKKPEYTISKEYLDEKIEFKSLDFDKWKTAKIAVVGKDGVKLYTGFDGQNEISDIPKGTILPLLEDITNEENKDPECGGIFTFKGQYNLWHKTEYNGKTGYVFGAFLVYGPDNSEEYAFATTAVQNYDYNIDYKDSDAEKLVKLAYYYTKPERSDSFYNFTGRKNLSATIIDSLEKNHSAIENINFDEYSKFLQVNGYDMSMPDDMIALYGMQHNDKMNSTFITIDLFVHCLHLVFDRMLQDTESSKLLPLLKNLTKSYYEELSSLETQPETKSADLKDAISMMKKYFLVTGDIMGLTLAGKEEYPSEVTAELELINSAAGPSISPLFNYKEDYSQFKPRGHYTKSEDLKMYFKAMMWYGRLHFYCVEKHPDSNVVDNSIRLTKYALLLTKIAKENKNILTSWKSLFTPITYIVGESDDYNLQQYISYSDNVDFNNFSEWITKKSNIINFIKKVNEAGKAPLISGNTLMQNPDTEKNSAQIPRGFRLFGQRFTLDGFIHNILSSPRVGTPSKRRTMVKGLDVMGVLGNKIADSLLANERKEFENFAVNYDLLKQQINTFDDNYWRNTFYRSYLRIIKEINAFDSTVPFYFAQSELWNKKLLLTSHAAWAELRHDTILYVKQSFAEMAGPGPCFSWDVDKLSRPTGYIEPNLGALYWIQSVLEDSADILSANEFMSDYFKAKFSDYKTLIGQVVEIAEKEASDEKITPEENAFIYQIPSRLAPIIMPPDGNIIDQNDLKMALVADVHTDVENNSVLEVATGIPYRIYVALNDGDGGKRIASGYIFSYYEFTQPSGNRLNDEQWKEIVYSGTESMDKYKPDWAKDLSK